MNPADTGFNWTKASNTAGIAAKIEPTHHQVQFKKLFLNSQ